MQPGVLGSWPNGFSTCNSDAAVLAGPIHPVSHTTYASSSPSSSLSSVYMHVQGSLLLNRNRGAGVHLKSDRCVIDV